MRLGWRETNRGRTDPARPFPGPSDQPLIDPHSDIFVIPAPANMDFSPVMGNFPGMATKNGRTPQ